MSESSTQNADADVAYTKRPILSILIYNYNGKYLGRCLEAIFSQEIITHFEVILIDDATWDGTWDTALEFLQHHSDRITFQRNRFPHGPGINFQKALSMAKGEFFITLSADQAFRPNYIGKAIQAMKEDPYAEFGGVHSLDGYKYASPFRTNYCITDEPLVSILCYNYNYGKYLAQSLESVFQQTYKNIELCFSDNASTDESWSIALEFARKYPHQVYLVRNRDNFGVDANFANCLRNMNGKYYINFCSDDVLAPEYVKKCVEVLEPRPNVGMVIVHRSIIDEHGRPAEEPPFYNQSCVIPGHAQAAVYMMAGVNPSVSQIMYRSAVALPKGVSGGLVARYYGTRILDFNISLEYDIGYLKDPLLLHRIHSQSDTRRAESNLLPVIGWYILNHQLAELATIHKVERAARRLPESIEKLAHLAIRYAVRALMDNDEETACRYFHLAAVMTPTICEDARWKQLEAYWSASSGTRREIIDLFSKTDNLVSRSVSYDPPAGSEPLEDPHMGRSPSLPPLKIQRMTPPTTKTLPEQKIHLEGTP